MRTRREYADLNPPERRLFGTGPTNPDPRVLRALGLPIIGQFDPAFTAIMNEVGDLCRFVFRTENARAFPVSGTSRAGLEAGLCSLIEPGDRVVVVVAGRFGELLAEISRRCDAEVVPVETAWGRVTEPDALRAALAKGRPKVVALVHGDTSTGVLQPLPDLVRLAHDHGAVVLVDAVLTLGGVPVETDGWGLDVCVAGTQKCLGCPSGMAPLTYTAAVEDMIAARRRPVQSNYLDLGQIQAYWGPDRLNHHTLPTSMTYGLREALRLIYEEGLETRWERHRRTGAALHAGIEAMGLRLFGDPAHQLPMLAIVEVPDGASEPGVRDALLRRHRIEIMAAFGPLRGRAWRIGFMAYNAEVRNVIEFLDAFEDVLADAGVRVPRGAGPAAAARAGRV
ncbi:MAG TPA: alanine--glyoxylate aminotransferase family protein [bacterium]|nr:alanine--glyoxylate aminotransferase family protein [bacterium]